MSLYSTAQSLRSKSGTGNNVTSCWTREHHKINVTPVSPYRVILMYSPTQILRSVQRLPSEMASASTPTCSCLSDRLQWVSEQNFMPQNCTRKLFVIQDNKETIQTQASIIFSPDLTIFQNSEEILVSLISKKSLR